MHKLISHIHCDQSVQLGEWQHLSPGSSVLLQCIGSRLETLKSSQNAFGACAALISQEMN